MEISGKNLILIHRQNKRDIFITLFMFHFEMSGNSFNDEHFLNNSDISSA